ncbi:MAG: serine/threonine protein kinase [Myxococcales bacterium]|nr:MAG: serine/threonine protein kinase [Myxococcales bacterium]
MTTHLRASDVAPPANGRYSGRSVAQDVAPQGLVAGKYRLTTLIGRGGMGSVWEGTHATLGTHVAVKFIESEYAESPEARNRFENEARAAARLRSKHVVEVYDHGVTDDGSPFIVMEYLRGEPLDKRLDRVGRIPAREAARIVMQVCRALAKAHAAGIVHRDLKPENVFLVWDEEDGADVVKVVDFGIAKFTDNQLGNSSATRTGSVLGTPYYMSPEQARGLRSVDHRSDLWSVGVIAYRCIVGQLPFDGEAVGDLLVKLCTAPLPVPSQLAPDAPPGFDAWFTKALCREPEGRFSTASELAESLGAVCGLPVRGAYSTADIPMHSFASGPGATSTPGLMPGSGAYTPPAVLPVTPYPAADRSGPHGVYPAAATASTLQMATGAPTTQTPAPSSSRSTGAIIAAVAAAVVVLGIGVGVAFKLLAPAAEVAAPLAPVAQPTAEVAVTAAPPLAPPATAAASATAPPEPALSAAPPASAAATTVKPYRPVAPPHQPVRPPKPPGPAAGPDVGF